MTAVQEMEATTSLGSDFWSEGMEAWPKLTGRQEPHHLVATPGDWSLGEKTITLMERIRHPLMPWQGGAVRLIEATTAEGRWTHTDGVLICTRQNGKSELVSAVIIRRTMLSGQKVFYTAQRWKTAKEMYERTLAMIWSRPSLRRRIVKKTCSQGEGVLVFDNGGTVTFTTRSPDTGRGLTKLDLAVYDEAYNLSEGEMSALNYAQDAAEDPQTLYVSSAVNADEMPKGEVLSGLRRQALSGDDPQMFLIEYMAPEDMDRMDEATWKYANPSYGVIKTAEKIRKNMRGMATDRGRLAFDVDALGRGVWFEERVAADEFGPEIDLDVWGQLVDRSPVRAGHFVLAVEATPDEKFASIAQGVKTATGVHAQVIYHGPFDRAEVVSRIKSVKARETPTAVLLDPKSAAGAFRIPLEDAGIEVTSMTLTHVKEACRDFLVQVREGKATHDDDPRLVSALEQARLREFSDGSKAWERHSGEVSQLVALTHATWGVSAFKPQVVNAAPLKSVPAVPVGSGASWQSMSF